MTRIAWFLFFLVLLAGIATGGVGHAPPAGGASVGLTPQQQATKDTICRGFYTNVLAPSPVSLRSLAANCPGVHV